MTLRKFGSRLGVTLSELVCLVWRLQWSLGCGLSQACGIALGMRMNNDKRRQVYVVAGDGELDEGNIWEAAMLAPKYNLHQNHRNH